MKEERAVGNGAEKRGAEDEEEADPEQQMQFTELLRSKYSEVAASSKEIDDKELRKVEENLVRHMKRARQSVAHMRKLERENGAWEDDKCSLMMPVYGASGDKRRMMPGKWVVPQFGSQFETNMDEMAETKEGTAGIETLALDDAFVIARTLRFKRRLILATKLLAVMNIVFWTLAVVFYAGFMRFVVLPDDIDGDDWNYTYEKTGPASWHELDPGYRSCREGNSQSPVHILTRTTARADLEITEEESKPTPNNVISRIARHVSGNFYAEATYWQGPSFKCINEVEIEEGKPVKSCGELQWDSETYLLKEIRIHGPAEHLVNGRRSALEFYFVHESVTSNTQAIISMRYNSGQVANDTAVNAIWWDYLSMTEEKSEAERLLRNVQIDALYDPQSSFYYYRGSLTIPPCLEDVHWFIITDEFDLSYDQVLAFRNSAVGWAGNSRPTQPLHDRDVFLYEKIEPTPKPL